MSTNASYTETTDAPADASTPYTIASGDTFTGTIDSFGDTDWVAIYLDAGVDYTFSLTGADSGDGTLICNLRVISMRDVAPQRMHAGCRSGRKRA